ncbi:MAG TPA: hypothetical protein VHL11_21640 [Phototrophicaceae bacterium]|jgi:hypothetical protein|nr:hypothetical protein [Phototrophicaceae bacterium]
MTAPLQINVMPDHQLVLKLIRKDQTHNSPSAMFFWYQGQAYKTLRLYAQWDEVLVGSWWESSGGWATLEIVDNPVDRGSEHASFIKFQTNLIASHPGRVLLEDIIQTINQATIHNTTLELMADLRSLLLNGWQLYLS